MSETETQPTKSHAMERVVRLEVPRSAEPEELRPSAETSFASPLVLAVGSSVDAQIQAARVLALIATDPTLPNRPEELAPLMGMTHFGVVDLLASDAFRNAVSTVLRNRVELTLGYVHDNLVELMDSASRGTTAADARNRIAAAKTLISLRQVMAKDEADGLETPKSKAQAVGQAVLDMITLHKERTKEPARAKPPDPSAHEEDD